MTDNHVLKLWADAMRESDATAKHGAGRLLRFAALIREGCQRTQVEYYERVMAEPCEGQQHCTCVPAMRTKVEALEGKIEEAEQTAIDLRVIQSVLYLKVENLEKAIQQVDQLRDHNEELATANVALRQEVEELRAVRDLHRKAYWAYEPRNPQPVISGPHTETAP